MRSSVYSPKYHRAAEATLTYNETKGSITLAFEDGGQRHSARDIVRELWGELAGGHPGIAEVPAAFIWTRRSLDESGKR